MRNQQGGNDFACKLKRQTFTHSRRYQINEELKMNFHQRGMGMMMNIWRLWAEKGEKWNRKRNIPLDHVETPVSSIPSKYEMPCTQFSTFRNRGKTFVHMRGKKNKIKYYSNGIKMISVRSYYSNGSRIENGNLPNVHVYILTQQHF